MDILHAELLPAWVQAIGSILAILIAVWIARWTVRQQVRIERENRIVDNAAFASYIRDYLDSMDHRIDVIAGSVTSARDGETLSGICQKAFEAYNDRILKRLTKLADLPLTDWPDIELANAFYDANLRLKDEAALLEAETVRLAAEEDQAARDDEAARERRARHAVQEAEDDEDDAEAFLGAIDDGRPLILPPRGRRTAFAREVSFAATPEDEQGTPDWFDQRRIDRDDDDREEAYRREAARRQARADLDAFVFAPLRGIASEWSRKDAPLCAAIARYIDLARSKDLPATYQERAEAGSRYYRIFG